MITINTNPTNLPSLHDAMWHIVSSDNSATLDFKYIFDVLIGGILKVRVKQYPDPANGKGYFDAATIARNSMNYEWFEPLTSLYVGQPNLVGQAGIAYTLRVGEEVLGVSTTNMANVEVYGYNWAPNLFKRRVDILANKINKWLTNRPLVAKTKIGENLFIGFLTNISVTFNVQTFNHSNISIATASGTLVAVPLGFLQMNIGTAAVPITINDNVKYYDVWFNAFDKVRVYLTCNNLYTPTTIHFLNRWGLYDTHRFDLVSKLSMNVERKGYEKRDYKFNGNAVDYKSASNRYYEGNINHNIQAGWTYKLTADAMTDAEYEWISDLIVSPRILMEVDGYHYPVTLKNNNYEYSKHANNRLRVLELDFELNETRLSQLR